MPALSWARGGRSVALVTEQQAPQLQPRGSVSVLLGQGELEANTDSVNSEGLALSYRVSDRSTWYRLVRVSHKPSHETEIKRSGTTSAGEDLPSPSVPCSQLPEGQTPPPTQDQELPPHPERELLLPGESPLTGQSAEGRNEGASWSRGSAAIRTA